MALQLQGSPHIAGAALFVESKVETYSDRWWGVATCSSMERRRIDQTLLQTQQCLEEELRVDGDSPRFRGDRLRKR